MIASTLLKLCNSEKLRPSMVVKIAFAVFLSAFCSFSGAWEYDETGAPKAQMYHYWVKFLSMSESWTKSDTGYWNDGDYEPYMLDTTLESQLASAANAHKIHFDNVNCHPNATGLWGLLPWGCMNSMSLSITGFFYPEYDAHVVYKFSGAASYRDYEPDGSMTTVEWIPTGYILVKYSCPSPWSVQRTELSSEGTRDFLCVNYYANYCPSGYIYDENSRKCALKCADGFTWDSALKYCLQTPTEDSCETQSKNPIDFYSGKKYRSENVIAAGVNKPFSLIYYYNSQLGAMNTSSGGVRYLDGGTADSIVSKIPSAEYWQTYNKQGLLKADPNILQDQHYGSMHENWRHNYDDVLQIRNGKYLLHISDGKQLTFAALDWHETYKTLMLSQLSEGQESFNGYLLTDYRTNEKKFFDSIGRLRKLVRSNGDILTLEYDEHRLKSITNSEGAKIIFDEYFSLTEDSIYAYNGSTKDYPKKIRTSDGRQADLEWNKSITTIQKRSYWLTKITKPYIDAPEFSREFTYDSFSRMLNGIYEIDVKKNTRVQYAKFEYDSKRRAVLSELAGGVERISVDYRNDTTRLVKNALGLTTTYTFKFYNGVKRLESVSGDQTASCAPTNTIYSYYPNGSLETQTTNNISTHFTYNNRNLIETRTDAFGSPDEKITKTCWHEVFNKPERVIEARRVTRFHYYPDGMLKSKAVEARNSNNENCQ